LAGSVNRKAFSVVYSVVVEGKRVEVSGELLERCIEVASKNKILLHFLRALNIENGIRAREEARYRMFLGVLRSMSRALQGLDYAFIKLVKPVTYVPSDVDVLVDRRDLGEAVRRLQSLGFEIEVLEPYCITMRRGSAVVDLYLHLTLGGAIYIDARALAGYTTIHDIDGIEVHTLERWMESLVAAAHALYKERLYTLNDLVTVERWLSAKTIELARELRCLDALRRALTINHLVREGAVELPYKLPLSQWMHLLATKMLRDSVTRATVLNVFKALRDPRIGRLIVSKIMRESY